MQVQKQSIPLGHTIAGNPIELISYHLKSATEGRKLYIQSGMHGGEITYWVQDRLFNFLKENLKAGEVVFVPFANPAAWEQRSYFYTFGKFDLYDGRDFNYNFPGKPDGSLHQRIAHHLFKLAEGSHLALDLHTARDSVPFGIYAKDEYAPYIRDLGFKYNFLDAGWSPEAQGIDFVFDKAGIANICIECGSHDEYSEQKNDQVFAGILRLMARLEMIDDKFYQKGEEALFFDAHKKIVAPESGFIRYNTVLGQDFKKGDSIFTLFRTCELGTSVEHIASEDGVVYKRAPTQVYRVGDDTVHYVALKDLQKV